MTSAHGNKTVAAAAGLCFSAAALLFGGIISEKKAKIRMYETKYKKTVAALEINNQKIMAENK